MYKYPYGDSQQLNLDWILAKLKELEDAGIGLDLENVSKALISLPYNTSTAYRRYDYAFRNDKLYRCLSDTTGAFDPAAWQEALIGDDLAVLTRWINAIDAAAVVDVKFDTSGTNGKIQQKYHDQYHDVVEVDYTPVQNSKRPLSSNAGYELTTTKRISTLSDLDTSENHFVQFNANINVGGITFPEFSKGVLVTNGGTDATIYAIDVLTGSLFTADKLSGTWRHGRNITTEISNLNGAITSHASTLTGLENAIGYIETSSTASRNYVKDDYFFLTTNNRLYQATAAITSGTSIEGKIRWIPIGGFNHQRFKRICTSNTWSGSASDQVLPTLPITGSLSDYSEIKFVLRLASQAAEQTFMTDLILDGTIKYMYIPFVQDSQYFASCIVEYSSGSLKVNNYITTNSGWYSTTKQLYVYGK